MDDSNNVSSKYPDLAESIIDDLLNQSSINGLFILYALKEAFIKKVSLNWEDFCNSADTEYSYTQGFLLPLNAFRVYSYKTVQVGNDFEEIIETLHHRIIEKIDSCILKLLNEQKKEVFWEHVSDKFEKVMEYFEKN
jgi:uncharacterized membrane protein YgaE (UPF0421/DUF939 family)